MENITRTIYSSHLQTCLLTGLPFVAPANSTLNQKFDIQASVLVGNNFPKLQYFTIGNGGHRFIMGTSTAPGQPALPKPEPIQHRTTDAALFNHIPFKILELNEDTSAESVGYGLRVVRTFDNRPYVCYYAKELNWQNVAVELETQVTDNGVTTSSPFVPTVADNLNPTPPALANTGTNVTTGESTSASAKLTITLTPQECDNIKHACEVIYGDEGYAIISELGLVTAVKGPLVTVPVSGSGGGYTYNEIIGSQISAFISTFYPLMFNNNGNSTVIDVGCAEPLLSLTNAP